MSEADSGITMKSTTDDNSGDKMRSKTDPDLTKSNVVHSTMIHFDSLDETSSNKSGLSKHKTNRGNENYYKTAYNKNENRGRPRLPEVRSAADFRWNHVGKSIQINLIFSRVPVFCLPNTNFEIT